MPVVPFNNSQTASAARVKPDDPMILMAAAQMSAERQTKQPNAPIPNAKS